MSLGAARVIYTINDLSVITDAISKGYILVLVHTERGPLWTPTPIVFWDEYERLFGKLISASIDPLVLKMGLMQGAKFLVIRCVHCEDPADTTTATSAASTLTLMDRGGLATHATITSAVGPFTITAPVGGTVTTTDTGPFTFTLDTNDAVSVQVGSAAAQTFKLTGVAKTVSEVAAQFDAALDSTVTVSVENHLMTLTATDPTKTLTIANATHTANSTIGLGAAVYPITAGTDTLTVKIAGKSDQSFTLTAGSARTAGQIVAEVSPLEGATILSSNGAIQIVTDATGEGATVQIADACTSHTALGFITTVVTGYLGTTQETLTYSAKSVGVAGDNISIRISNSALHADTAFDVHVLYSTQSNLNEYYSDVDMDPDSSKYVVNVINEQSRLVEVEDEDSDNTPYSNRPLNTVLAGLPLTGGADGLIGFDDDDWIGDPLAQTGMYAVLKEDMAMDVMIPSSTSVTVLQALTAFCENTGKHIGYANTPIGLDPMAAKDWRMGEGAYSHEPFNSHRLSLWFGRPLVYDSRDSTRKYIPNLGHLASCITKNDLYYDESMAPVGPRRGKVDFVEGIDFNLRDYRGYQDMFADYCINYLQITRQDGAVFWEQRTTQREKSATQNLNTVRFLTAMRLVLEPVLRTFIFQPNHPVTWREVKRTLEPQFRLWKTKYQIYDYALQCDEDAFFDGGELKNAVLNSGLEIDQGIYRARALVQPTVAMLYVEFEVGVTRTGEAFSNFQTMKELPGWIRR